MTTFVAVFYALFAGFFGTRSVSADDGSEDDLRSFVISYIDTLDLGSLEGEYEPFSEYFEGKTLAETVAAHISGEMTFGFDSVLKLTTESVKKSFSARFSEVLSVIFIAVFSSLVAAIRPEGDGSVSRLTDFIFSLVTAGVTFGIFSSVYFTVVSVVERVSGVADGAYPVILTLFAASGASSSGATFSPAVSFLSGAYVEIIRNILLPLVLLSFVFFTVGGLSDRIKLNKFGDFFKSSFKWILGFITLVFCFMLTVGSVGASVFDGFSYKALKYAFSSGVPLVSQMIQGGFDVVFSSLVLIKNSVGIVAMSIILIYLLAPVVETAVMTVSLRLAAALVEPIGAEKPKNVLSRCADACSALSAVLVSSGICFCLTFFLIITALGGSV